MTHHHCGHGHQDHDLDERLHERFHHLQDHYRHGGLDTTLAPLPADEMVLDRLTDRIPGVRATEDYLAIEAWLTTAYTDRRGCYADPHIHVGSVLAAMVRERAAWLYPCPSADGLPGCPRACAGGEHRAQARAAFELSLLLERDRWDAYCQARD
ncbi:hypothetical protein ACFXPX_13470 [Kitasatospora sp. NPDC059146]|uniref:hypothetical protein n=1 Tax=Kitasatospora sp. NPDC059146 TaxID=3346741 RepID=UPI0036C44C53